MDLISYFNNASFVYVGTARATVTESVWDQQDLELPFVTQVAPFHNSDLLQVRLKLPVGTVQEEKAFVEGLNRLFPEDEVSYSNPTDVSDPVFFSDPVLGHYGYQPHGDSLSVLTQGSLTPTSTRLASVAGRPIL
jgi:hypothetical protein